MFHALRMLTGLLLFMPGIVFSQEQPATLADCASIVDDRQRLACYDRLAAASAATQDEKSAQGAAATTAATAPPAGTATANAQDERAEPFSLARHWELGPENKRGVFAFRPHYDNYVLFANYSAAPNGAPFTPLAPLQPPGTSLSHVEVKFQLGFKMKLVEDLSANHADLWFGYTQQSYWQAYNREASSPFRETDYQPELMLVAPVDFQAFGMRARFLNFGLVHQSNGRGELLSRSWNRFYVQAGMERGNLTLLARVWKRLDGGGSDDDNPDIMDFMGYGDLMGTYRWNGHEFSLLARQNFRTSRGAAQISWAFPLATRVKGYVQAFSGYGQSLIDYNYSQKTIGLGILVSY